MLKRRYRKVISKLQIIDVGVAAGSPTPALRLLAVSLNLPWARCDKEDTSAIGRLVSMGRAAIVQNRRIFTPKPQHYV
jgi:hypothetical protein